MKPTFPKPFIWPIHKYTEYLKDEILFMMILLMAGQVNLSAQTVLQPEDGLGNLFGGGTQITEAKLIADGETRKIINVSYTLDSDKEFLVQGCILDKRKKVLKDIPPATFIANGKSGSGDLVLSFSPVKNYSQGYLQTHFIRIILEEKGGMFQEMACEMGGLSLSGSSQLYPLDTKWRVKGSENMRIQVTLTPYKSASSITP